MITLNANPNATISVVDGSFPIGQLNVIYVNILDPLLIKKIGEIIYTGTCSLTNNLYSYSEFNKDTDLEKLTATLSEGSSVEIVNGKGINYSRCLECNAGNEGLGSLFLKPDKEITEDTTYTFSMYIYIPESSTNTAKVIATTENDKPLFQVTNLSANSQWVFITKDVSLQKDNGFKLNISIEGTGTCYIDNISLFEKSDEITKSYTTNAEIVIDNPCQPRNKKVMNTTSWNYDEDKNTLTATIYMPKITTVDFQNNLLCRFNIYQFDNINSVADTIGNWYYKDRYYIYNSEPFVLNGYIIPSQSDCDCKLIVKEI